MLNSALPWAPGRSPNPPLLTRAAILGITGYQRYLSPYKGFSCAYRVHRGAESCSQYVKRILREEGLTGARAKTQARFADCREAHLALRAAGADGALFSEAGWLPELAHGALQAGTWCIPTPVGCCFVSS